MSLPVQPDAQPQQVAAGSTGVSLPQWLPPLFYALLAALFLWRSTFAGDVFLPAGLLGYMHPFSSQIHADRLPPWNPLRWDGIAQFYPWRHFAAQTMRTGFVPLWNPNQFCGTPFIANSQSAVLYPGNLLFLLIPTALAFNWSALLHLTLCGWFTFLFLKSMRRSDGAALFGGVVFAYSSWQTDWLQLPTFLATSCWLPLLLRQIYLAYRRNAMRSAFTIAPTRYNEGNTLYAAGRNTMRSAFTIAPVVGLMLLAGHLQIAFYGLLAGVLWSVALMVRTAARQNVRSAGRLLGILTLALAMGLFFSMPQLLPSIELSRRSHRVGTPTSAGYAAYVEYALPPSNLVTLTLPDFFGNDHDSDNPYWGFYTKWAQDGSGIAIRHNAAETAIYIGIVPLLLAALAMARACVRRTGSSPIWFFAALGLLAMLLALGTSLNAVFYFGIPGFGQSGSPARALVLWAFAGAVLAAFGLDSLRNDRPTRKHLILAVAGLALLVGFGIAEATSALTARLIGLDRLGFAEHRPPDIGEILSSRLASDWLRLSILTAASLCLMLPTAWLTVVKTGSTKSNARLVSRLIGPMQLAVLLIIVDLFSVGISANPTSPGQWVYPETEGIRFLKRHLGHERLFPVNRRWSLMQPPDDVLPPNAALAYGILDVQGYDSLLTGRYKAFANQFARQGRNGSRDASPPEVGNMVFFQDPTAPETPLLGASFAVTLPSDSTDFADTLPPPGLPIYSTPDEMSIYALPGAKGRARFVGGNGLQCGNVSYEEDGPTRVRLRVEAPVPGTVVLSDQIYPGWKVQVDGTAAGFVPDEADTSGVFRAVHIAAGMHHVAFLYDPASFRVGLYLALMALLGHIAALAIWIRLRKS